MKRGQLTNPIEVKLDHGQGFVERATYARAKWRQLVEFGYANLTLQEVEEQIDAVIAGKKIGEGRTVIGVFMEKELAPQVSRAALQLAKEGR